MMFVWLVWAFLFLDFRFLAIRPAYARVSETLSGRQSQRFQPDLAGGGFIGCKFSDVCTSREDCLDDNFFGSCVSREVDNRPIWFGTHKNKVLLSGLDRLLEGLWMSKFTWRDVFTQCIVKTVLFSYKMLSPVDLRLCERLVKKNGNDDAFGKRSRELLQRHKYDLSNFPQKQLGEQPEEELPEDVFLVLPLAPEEREASEKASGGEETWLYPPSQEAIPEEAEEAEEAPPLKEEEEEEDGQPAFVEDTDSETDMAAQLNSLESQLLQMKQIASEIPEKPDFPLKKRIFSSRSYPLVDDKERVVDRSWIWLHLDSRGTNGSSAEEFLESLSKKLDFTLDDANFQGDQTLRQITFKISKFSRVSSEDVVNYLRNNSEVIPGVTILDVGYGTPQNHVSKDALGPTNNRFLITAILCSAVMGAVFLVFIIFLIQRRRISSGKAAWMDFSDEATSSQAVLQSQSAGSDEYQDLCRQRAHGKSVKESIDEDFASTRTGLSLGSDELRQTNMDISTGHAILNYMEKHLHEKDKLQAEWNTLCSYQPDGVQQKEALRDENAQKNRYIDALPYDHSRVQLKKTAPGSTDYINASFIVDHDPKTPLYIVTQGPLVNTVNDFWQMIWEQNVAVIVNLSCLIEAGAPMCHKYWPEDASQKFGGFEVNLVSEHLWCKQYLVRSFFLKNQGNGETRTVTQFHYIAWPDSALPSSAPSLLDFRRKVNRSFRDKSSPILVHCSDGCGRSGTFVLLDLILNRLAKGVKEVDVAASLEHIRDQRVALVKTKEQFEFILTCLGEEVQSILNAISHP